MANRPLRSGNFVRARTNDFGPGRLVAVDDHGMATVRYFDSIADGGQPEFSIPCDQLELATIWPQSRVFFRDQVGNWRSGRTIYSSVGQDFFTIRTGSTDEVVKAKDVFPRWQRPLENPDSVAMAMGFESPDFADRRTPFLEHVLRQRAASRGLSAITSSVIEHHPHQLRIARRVLQDPVQRYLLADEVGLGKTIEAGIILRQLLIDDATVRAVVLAPRFLIPQWQRELDEKFLLGDFPRDAVAFAPHEEPRYWPKNQDLPGIIIVDEAQHLAALWKHPKRTMAARYTRLADLGHRVERLLLLSATPVLHQEAALLAMLHLLDPEVHDLADLDGFRARVAKRAEVGKLFFTFREDTPPFLLGDKIDQLGELFPSDTKLSEFLDQLSETVAAGQDPTYPIRRIRTHVSESYRLHRRMVRTRRSTALESYRVAGRSEPISVFADDPVVLRLEQLVDDWRSALVGRLATDPTVSESDVVDVLLELLTWLLSDHERLAAWARRRLEGDAETAGRTFFRDEDERPILKELAATATESRANAARVQLAVDVALDKVKGWQKALVFTSSTRIAAEVHAQLSDFLVGSREQVAIHTVDLEPEEAEAEVARFADPNSRCQYLVCDRSAEEGRNLQIAEVVIHVDLPVNPNRLEQRIGRFDRFAIRVGEPGRSFVIGVGAHSHSYEVGWLRCLREGFEIFDRSIASLQHTVDQVTRELWLDVLSRGVSALEDRIPPIQEALNSELLAIAQQDALDSIEVVEDDDDFDTQLAVIEGDWPEFREASLRLIDHKLNVPGNLRFVRVDDEEGRTSFKLGGQFLIKDVNRLPKLPWNRLVDMAGSLNRPGVFERAKATACGGDTRLFRYGEPFIDQVTSYLLDDDRGRVFALWRPTGDESLQQQVCFAVKLRVEGNRAVLGELAKEFLDASADINSLLRRLDEFFPPRFVSLWLYSDGSTVDDPELLQVLQLPYDKRRGDRNLADSKSDLLSHFFTADRWRSTVDLVSASAMEHGRDLLDRDGVCEAASARAAKILGAKIEQIRARADQFGNVEDRLAVDVEQMLSDLITNGVREPRIEVDALGVFALSNRPPP